MKKKVLFLCVIILIMLAVVRISQRGKQVPTATEQETIIPVKVIKVERSVIRETVSGPGDVKPWAEVTVYPEVTGRAEKIFVKEGQTVKQGDLLAQIDYEKTALTIKQIESQIESVRTNFEKLKKDYERIKRLFEQQVVAEKTLDDAKAALDTTKYNMESLQSELDLAKVRLRDANVTAPISGMITKKFIDEGQMIINGPLVTIVNIDKVKVTVAIGERDITKIKKGQRSEVLLDAYPERKFSGEVYNIIPQLDFQTRTANVEIAVGNPGHMIKPGMFARTDIVVTSHENVFVIPIDTIIEKEGRKYVFVAEQGKASIREIITGLEKDPIVEVISGLKEMDDLIVEGQHLVQNGSKISIVK